MGAERLVQRAHPLARGHGDDSGEALRQAFAAGLDLLAHVRDVESLHPAVGLEDGHGDVGVVGVHVDLERLLVADDEHGVSDLLEPRHVGATQESLAGDDEVGAVAKAQAGLDGGASRAAGRRATAWRASGSPRRPATTPASIKTRP